MYSSEQNQHASPLLHLLPSCATGYTHAYSPRTTPPSISSPHVIAQRPIKRLSLRTRPLPASPSGPPRGLSTSICRSRTSGPQGERPQRIGHISRRVLTLASLVEASETRLSRFASTFTFVLLIRFRRLVACAYRR